jgi:peptidoglycan hydrolase CwlO-like protein
MQMLLTWLKSFFSKGQNILIFINIALIAYVFYLRRDDTSTIDSNVKQINVLNIRIDSLTSELKSLNPKLDSNNRAIDSVKTKIRSNDVKLQDIQKSAKKRDSILNNLTPDQLQKFFTDY